MWSSKALKDSALNHWTGRWLLPAKMISPHQERMKLEIQLSASIGPFAQCEFSMVNPDFIPSIQLSTSSSQATYSQKQKTSPLFKRSPHSVIVSQQASKLSYSPPPFDHLQSPYRIHNNTNNNTTIQSPHHDIHPRLRLRLLFSGHLQFLLHFCNVHRDPLALLEHGVELPLLVRNICFCLLLLRLFLCLRFLL